MEQITQKLKNCLNPKNLTILALEHEQPTISFKNNAATKYKLKCQKTKKT
jgi:hypothetical protein